MAVPGDTKTEYYIPRMEWANNNKELAILRINRLQNTIDIMLANVKTGSIQTIYIDRDGAWLDLHDESLQWLNNNKSFTWIS
jgi:dipeptidyl-peptidase-4